MDNTSPQPAPPLPPQEPAEPPQAPLEPAESQQHYQETLTLPLLGLILSVFIAPVGFIVSFITLRRTKERSIGWILSISGIIISSILILLFLMVAMLIYRGFEEVSQNNKKTSAAYSAAYDAQNVISSYKESVNGQAIFPTSLRQLNQNNYVRFKPFSGKAPTNPRTIEYAWCNDGKVARLGYWDYSDKTAKYIYIRVPGIEPVNCKVVTE